MNNLNSLYTMEEIVCWGESELLKCSIKNARREIYWMLEDICQVELSDIYLRNQKISKKKINILIEWIERRKKREPIQRILGKTEFYGYNIFVNPGVFIPRPETEKLIDVIKDFFSIDDKISIIDIGTGTGCISIALAKIFINSNIKAIDNSEIALKNATLNKEHYKLKNIKFSNEDIFKRPINETYDLIVSNPPYIPQSEMNTLMKEVLNYDPKSALTDDSDGLKYYKYYALNFFNLTKSSGVMILEVGNDNHPQKAKNVFEKEGLNAQLIDDYSGFPRVLVVTKTS